MRVTLKLLILMGFIISASIILFSGLANSEEVFKDDFESLELGLFRDQDAHTRWPSIKWVQLLNRFEVIETEKQGKALRVKYPGGGVGPSESGGQFPLYFEPADEYILTYKLYFEEGFEFKLGGKLPGLSSGAEKYSGGIHASKGDGWSARFMWRENGQAELYLYYIDNPEEWGQSVLLDDLHFKPGIWYEIKQRVRVNTDGKKDAEIQVWVNNNLVLNMQDFRLRVGDAGQVDSMYFSTFFGGNQPNWAPDKDVYIRYDDFKITKPL